MCGGGIGNAEIWVEINKSVAISVNRLLKGHPDEPVGRLNTWSLILQNAFTKNMMPTVRCKSLPTYI